MATLIWDQVGEKKYQTGVDRGVLYLQDGTSVPWNGLISIDESVDSETKTVYLDGVKYLEALIGKEFKGKLTAYTYPDEFDSVNGISDVAPGFSVYEQPSKSFSLSYRTRIGNDVDGVDSGYKIHILYNLTASPEDYGFSTISDSINPIEFAWNLSGIPVKFDNFRPAVHVSVNSTEIDPEILEALEGMLYGTESLSPRLPSIVQVAQLFGYLGELIIVDNGDGTWSAIDSGDEYYTTYISMIDATTFQIDDANVTILNADTYTISSTDSQWE